MRSPFRRKDPWDGHNETIVEPSYWLPKPTDNPAPARSHTHSPASLSGLPSDRIVQELLVQVSELQQRVSRLEEARSRRTTATRRTPPTRTEEAAPSSTASIAEMLAARLDKD